MTKWPLDLYRSSKSIARLLHSGIVEHSGNHLKKWRLQLEKDHLSLKNETTGLKTCLTYSWLRDHCRSSKMYNHETHQRSLDILHIPLDQIPKEVILEDSGHNLRISWPDGHRSQFDTKWLLQNSLLSKDGDQAKKDQAGPWMDLAPSLEAICENRAELWDAKSAPTASASMTFDCLCGPSGVKEFSYKLIRHGFAMVTGAPPTTEEGTMAVVNKLVANTMVSGPNFAKNPKGFWEFTSQIQDSCSDTAYSNISLGSHLDGSYMTYSPGVQVFHCLKKATTGGENVLVDGFMVARKFQEKSPEGFKFFSSVPLEAEYLHSNPNEHYYNVDRYFKLIKHGNPAAGSSPQGASLVQIRYNIYDRAPHRSVDLEGQRQLYSFLPLLAKEVNNPENSLWLTLEPGTVLFINNWRVMHGRAAFQGTRKMSGCYISMDDFISCARWSGAVC